MQKLTGAVPKANLRVTQVLQEHVRSLCAQNWWWTMGTECRWATYRGA